MSNASVLERLGEQAHRGVGSAIRPGSKCALLGYPNHSNPGDHAIWLGAKFVLSLIGAEIVYECSWRDYSRRALAVAVGDGAEIVFTGGGNFGDLWPATHALRETVLHDFRGTRIVQLQQTIHFRRSGCLDRTRKLLARHGQVTLVVRDRLSLELARRSFDVEVRLAPDLAFAYPLQAPGDVPDTDLIWIAREDRESRRRNHTTAPSGAWRLDWNLREAELVPLRGEAPLPEQVLELVDHNRALTKRAEAGYENWWELAQIRDRLSKWRIDRAARLLRRGRVIVTDSLHAHILGLMLGIPTVVTDNNYGKLRSTFETFTHDAPHACWAETPEQALSMARRRLAASASAGA